MIRREWAAMLLFVALVASCASAPTRAVEEPAQSEAVSVEREEAAKAPDRAEEMTTLSTELDQLFAQPVLDCALAQQLRDRICELSDRICELAEDDGESEALCTDSRTRCETARRRVSTRCPTP